MEPYMLTYSLRFVNPLDVRPEDVCEEDVAHHLALINRFNGATRWPISVAQHAVYVSRLLDGTGFEWQGLHHDDGEAYCGDMTKWLKESPEMSAFRFAEGQAQRSCYRYFNEPHSTWDAFPDFMHPMVKTADDLMVRFEGEKGFTTPGWKSWLHFRGIEDRYPLTTVEERERIGPWTPWSWRQAEDAWLTRLFALRFASLGDER